MYALALLAAAAVSSGTGALVGILVAAGRPLRASAPGGNVPRNMTQTLALAVRRLAPPAYLDILERQLALAGRPVGWTIERMLLVKPILTVLGLVLAGLWIAADPVPVRLLLGTALLALCFFVPDLLLYSRAQERQEKIQLELPDTLDQMTISVEAGLGFEAAMAKVGTSGRGPLAGELIRTLQDMSMGLSRRDAYHELAGRTSSPDLRRFARSVVQADAYGIAIADVLRVQAQEMRVKRRQAAEEKAMKVPVKVLFPLIFCILPVLFIVLMTPAALNIADAFF
ncbi:type II secretion system F family protein [Cryobacterium roopkundense]|uniref:Tight adherence protein C n=1 Tax=Cryobacterium roopkundense TaxID=1001240 RepID=A0A7W9E3T8_9MICO|nr:type II secretion system F family protein [Cryobacterium roopkundense]MBB5641498.1 tight adherence protein C [Cryobacterium roopkundense]